ncbi:glycoside hydrolase family protein [Kurthia sibirica]|uniref:Lysozyme n=1 Tax=Kurthia sibirica TaxID=202750 RepID=A0A2U3AP30_9BACL|nr:glycoside hydrolase family protein [Kurthia sibirica]PWI26310.1 hypothetical protein DEX24_02955 [Kurthia sibirica]GEK35021.1 hypothetical protein KSI01_25540 [Kurthia sibirica]
MNSSEIGKNLIKKYEGCRLKAYKPVVTEKYWTIGWGHYGAEIYEGMIISQQQADAYFLVDLRKYEYYVNVIPIVFNQNQFDALVSFCYNCGAKNLQRLCEDRTISSISKWLPAYNKAGGKVLKGLVRRRAEEKALFDQDASSGTITMMRVTSEKLNIRQKPSMTAAIVGKLLKGNTVQVVHIDKHRWAKIKSNGQFVYVSAIYLENS